MHRRIRCEVICDLAFYIETSLDSIILPGLAIKIKHTSASAKIDIGKKPGLEIYLKLKVNPGVA